MESRVFLKGLFIFLLVLFAFFIPAKASEGLLVENDKEYIPSILSTNLVDIPEDPSMFAIAGVNYIHQSSFCEINLEAYDSGRLRFQLTNLSGEVLFFDQKLIFEGINNIGLSIKDYPIGSYHLEMNLGKNEKVLLIEKVSTGRLKLVWYLGFIKIEAYHRWVS